MARDEDGLPKNLSPLELHMACWRDERGIHIAIFDRPDFDKIPEGANIMDYLDDAHYILSLNGWGGLRLAEQLMHHVNAGIVQGTGIFYDPGAPRPFPSESRHRIYARDNNVPLEQMEHGGVVDENGNQMGHGMGTGQTWPEPKGQMWDQLGEILSKEPESPSEPGKGPTP